MPDGFDCGVYVFTSWQRGAAYTVRWLGEFQPDMPIAEIHRRSEHHKLTAEFREQFARGWAAAKSAYEKAGATDGIA